MHTDGTLAKLGSCSPFLIVGDLDRSLAFYSNKLGFECRYLAPKTDPFFAIVGRDSTQLMLKSVGVEALPNPMRHADARWDIFIFVSEPDRLAKELTARDVEFIRPVSDTSDGLRGFELSDPDKYVCFFGRPK